LPSYLKLVSENKKLRDMQYSFKEKGFFKDFGIPIPEEFN
jgi:hypothetical protein